MTRPSRKYRIYSRSAITLPFSSNRFLKLGIYKSYVYINWKKLYWNIVDLQCVLKAQKGEFIEWANKNTDFLELIMNYGK